MDASRRLLRSAAVLGLSTALTWTASGLGSPPAGAPDPARQLEDRARELDRLVEAGLEEAGMQRNPALDDEAFLRRAWLQIAGRIPTPEEAREFLEDPSLDRRARLLDRLLESPGYRSRMFHFWADLLRVRDRLSSRVSGEPWKHFLQEAIAENLPYDEMVRQMLTAGGPAHAPGNGATGYFLRDRGMQVENMAITLRVFLGSRLECAQCHDHPFDDWKQRQFYEMAAFTGGLSYRADLRGTGLAETLAEVRDRVREEFGRSGQRAFGILADTLTAGLSGSGTGYVRLPDDYAYDDASPGQWITAGALFGEDVVLPDQIADDQRVRSRRRRDRPFRPRPVGSRLAFADWMTSPDNPLFTRTIVNRMWKLAFGRGLIEPVDDLKPGDLGPNPELLAWLERLMVELDYDLKAFLRVLYNSRTWQSGSSAEEPGPEAPWPFPGPVLKRMSAEQVWDSLITLVRPDVDATIREPGAGAQEVYRRYEELTSLDAEGLFERVREASLRFTDPEEFRRLQRERARSARRAQEETRARARPLYRELARARRRGNREAEEEVLARLRELGLGPPEEIRRQRAWRDLVRASELPSPAPAGHLLRQFGQSDREQVDGARHEPSVPQALALMNGFTEERILGREESVLWSTLQAIQDPAERVRTAFLAILSREPAARELRLWEKELGRDLEAGTRDLVWVLLNSHEFLFLP